MVNGKSPVKVRTTKNESGARKSTTAPKKAPKTTAAAKPAAKAKKK
jgi:hypothetical protein